MNAGFSFSRRIALAGVVAAALGFGQSAMAHGSRVGDLTIEHPYATPTVPGATNGAAYFREIRNRGKVADRLVAASTEVAEHVELHEMKMDGDVMRMREIPAIELPAGETVQLRHGQGFHLMLMKLKKPLEVGDRFDLTLRFERAGERTVKVWVQQPKSGAAAHDH